MSNETDFKSGSIKIYVEDPIELSATATGELEVACFQAVGVSQEPLKMILVFRPQAAGRLVHAIQTALQTGYLTIESAGTRGKVQ